jgi:hypothetical protein
VPTDPRRLRPAELCRLLNSTPLGEVLSERRLHQHRSRAGLRLGDAKHVDLLRYAAWLFHERRAAKAAPAPADAYANLKERARARNAALALAGRDIGELPPVMNPERKARAAGDFRFFCESYFPRTFTLPWSPDHLRVIAKIEQAVLRGGLFAMAMPRGSGKTSLCECACAWAVLHGHRDFVALIGSDEGHAMGMLESIKGELDGNDLLLEDYPEAVYPIRALDGIANRCAGQLYQGRRTHVGWTAKEVVLPTIEGSRAAGAVIQVAGITGRIRGMKHKRADGRAARPSLVVLDDPQTDESARSLAQCAAREAVLAGAVLGLAGPGRKIAGIMPCTVIRPGDMADAILDRGRHPEWNGERTRMVYRFPADEKLWARYAELRAEGLRQGDGGAAATEFYRANRTAMDDGAEIAWPERHDPDELSAIQHAMNLKLRDEAAFFAEYQNQPLPDQTIGADELTAEQVMAKINRRHRGDVPLGCDHVTAFIDVQGALLFYVVCAWADDFTGYVIDYGTFPDQRRPYFTLRDARHTLEAATGVPGLEGSVYAGLDRLVNDLAGREWRRDDEAALTLGRCLIDANWGNSTEVVYQYCRQSAHPGVVMPSHGRFVGAASVPFAEYRPEQGCRAGHNWRVPPLNGRRPVRHLLYDTNYWKSFVMARLAVPLGELGCLSLFGERPESHRLFAEHLTAEYRVRTEGRGRRVDEWRLRPERGDNHWLDGLVGCAAAASLQGAALPEHARPKKVRKHLTFEELYRRGQESPPL